MTQPTPQTNSRSGITRRTVVKGAAWAVPAIAVAGAMPATAVSGNISFSPTVACKSPGASCETFYKGYVVGFQVCNNTAVDIHLRADCVYGGTINAEPANFKIYKDADWLIDPGQCQTILIGIENPRGASPQAAIAGTIRFTWWDPNETPKDCRSEVAAFNAAPTPPCGQIPDADGNCPPPATGQMTTPTMDCPANSLCPV